MLILAIETSCDETSAAVVHDGKTILSNRISSQIEIHKQYGGVVPEIASRHHVENIGGVVAPALSDAGVTLDEVGAIAVTDGPGLVGALLVGVSYAKAMAYALKKPLIPVHHIKGHICANYLDFGQGEVLKPPFVCLVASGGHSHIVNVKDYYTYDVLGRTRDDAAGEAFDKIARVLGLGYPGGPAIDAAAKRGNPQAIKFPRVSFGGESLDFSFSGVKTAVINHIHKLEQKGEEIAIFDVAASFQQAVVDMLVEKTITAATRLGVAHIALAGGVACNSLLRGQMAQSAAVAGIAVSYPPPILCTDNAAMIAAAAHLLYQRGEVAGLELNAVPSKPISLLGTA